MGPVQVGFPAFRISTDSRQKDCEDVIPFSAYEEDESGYSWPRTIIWVAEGALFRSNITLGD